MKRILIAFAAAGTMLFTACDKRLDLEPYNALSSETIFNTESDFENVIRGMYRNMVASGSYYGGIWNIFADVSADNAILNRQGRLTQRVYSEWRYNSNNTIGLYANAYGIIRISNSILENIDKLSAGNFRNNAQGEALAVRAMLHFDLARTFAKTPTNASATDLGVPYVVSTDLLQLPARETVAKTYELIAKDLEDASGLINLSNGTGRLSRAAVLGLLSKVYLYMGRYEDAIAKATESLNIRGNVGTIAQFPSIWRDATEEGVLFKLKIINKDNVLIGVNYSQTLSAGIRSEYNADYEFYNSYKNTDVRKAAYFTTSAYNGVTYNHIVKWYGRTGDPLGVLDYKALRVADVLLVRAESYARTGKEAEALADLNKLRENRYTDYAPLNLAGDALLTEILKERRWEMAYEGDRFFDLKRRNQPVARNTSFGDRADGSGDTYVFGTLPVGDNKFQLPFPQSEINANTNLIQNPGY
ncbi:RagB/SusD family nutrient uptake outer membrane protein [Flavihumibacter rivuli]|uniref:RagB/SusD family nutrient uptake outer membrane protein n=1 Tax=Flavihumibacter rivuli TaxID=2838156 RepID=UPI001BDED943|nr:RagB/SusD family nutrient uptake outer membrane protein [Flavihumibacter rivuli]ULQ55104.1 RagB/SusD family nutrient uptake outer membrane protein [Flavihumibacter rivuli]